MKKECNKKLITLLFIASVILAGIWLRHSYRIHNEPKMGPVVSCYPDLFIGEYTIADKEVSLYQYEEDETPILIVPFTKLLEGLGFPVTWMSPYTASFSINDQAYSLSLQDCSICKAGETKNQITSHCFTNGNQELYLDILSSGVMCKKMGLSISILWDSSQNSVFVMKGEGNGNLTYDHR